MSTPMPRVPLLERWEIGFSEEKMREYGLACYEAGRADIMTTPLFDPQDAQKRIDSLRAALNLIAYSRWSTETPGQFVEVLQKMARDALIANAKLAKDRLAQPAPGTPSPKIHISKHDAADWLESRSAIIEALEKAGLCLWSNAEGFWIAPAPAQPVAWQQTTADGEPMWGEGTFLSTPRQFAYSRPLYAKPVQTAPADDAVQQAANRLLNEVWISKDRSQFKDDIELIAHWALEGKT